jgi:prephenate dehydrogenase
VRLAILGLGLIGGSIARAVRRSEPTWPLAAWTPAGGGPAAALEEGAIDVAAASLEAAVHEADLIVLGAPPLACLDLLDRLAAVDLPAGAVVTDVASTKRRIVGRAAELGLPFVGGHPMAGREEAGFAAADPGLFVDRPWVICGSGTPATRLEQLVAAVGARAVRMDPPAHDAAVAAVSHLPLVLSAALVETVATGRTPAWAEGRTLAAGGWASMTRLARGDVEMGAGILATNADHVAERLRVLRDVLDGWIAALEADEPDVEALRGRLATARDALESQP